MNNSITSINETQDFSLPGPARLRKTYRHRLNLSQLGKELGVSRDRLYKRIRAGNFNLPIYYNECKMPFALIEDLIQYLYPSSPVSPALSPDTPEAKPRRGPGRPRKSAQIGGAR